MGRVGAMKTELIEHHRSELERWRSFVLSYPTPIDAAAMIAFHERAVAWLEGLGRHEQFDDMGDAEFLKVLFAQARRRHLNAEVSDGVREEQKSS